ncbi:UvrD-helicase domain-containing protein [Candidatus Contubernalis alkaliaceticus]|uniref:UvrD-helicase domain-containing protein n=1 Tax=Candidatus Contubernalis alkaliaceticus TaxID=338645 RepID=UPI001F4C2BE9|nr:UvrD-helicase domain-containing protein [Candidatus Contubernalis alkalaceticus]UNC91798.1 UvrD-helicase domain-containing protein [Candidatus Contubernalis alkalaceticus]
MKTGKDKAGSDWTLEQRQAIDWKDSHVLVSAGAGSGKTRVLVERIIEKITDQNNPEEIDRFLVVTFTNAAAAEMKRRINRALQDSFKNRPESAYLRRQQMILNRASICTIHSFCMEVMQQFYYLLDLDPSFRIIDQTEGDLLRQEVLEQVMENYYLDHTENSPFYSLVDAYSSERGDDHLKELVLKMYEFSRSHPYPREWLLNQVETFRIKNLEEVEQSPWVNILLKDTRLELEGMMQQLKKAETLCNQAGGPLPYLDNLIKEKDMIDKSLRASRVSWAEIYSLLKHCDFGRLKGCKGDAYEESLKEKVKQLRDKVKSSFKKLQEEIFQCSLEEYAVELGKMAPLMEILVNLVLSFEKAYTALKRERGAVDFSDLEHCTLQILGTPNHHEGTVTLTEAAKYYQDRFNHVMVDEYQDINLVQEAIIKRVSREEGVGGNLFMVGDVKQSIYRFRLAEPELFLEKLSRYKQKQGMGKTIILNKNFRSRKEVLEGVNYLFRQIMDEAVGEMDYDREAELTSGIVPCLSSLNGEEGEVNEPGDFIIPEIVIISRSELQNKPCAQGNLGLETPKWEKDKEDTEEDSDVEALEDREELENAQMEGRYIAEKIREYIGRGDREPVRFFCKKEKRIRPVTYRDIVILLRSAPNWTSIILEELQRSDIPAYGEQRSGYFEAVEVEVMLSLLKVIDNPYQDIPLAAVLRSPLAGLSAEEMAVIKAENMGMSFFDALTVFNSSDHYELKEKIQRFLKRLKKWQSFVHQGELGELIWKIYQETRYYELMGCMEGGMQRQANLRALYDRARQYESTSFRGLFRFLRFIEKLRDMGGDLGAARTLGEQENVVRIMTIHKSKGLEFPIVFLAGMGRQFNRRDLHGDFLLHKKLGFGPKRVDMDKKVIYPTLPFLAVKKRLGMEMLAEEMRVLYVAMTRAEEKLIMVGTVNDLCKETIKWSGTLVQDKISKKVIFSSYARASAKSYLDWVGPSMLNHPAAEKLRDLLPNVESFSGEPKKEGSRWKVTLLSCGDLTVDEKLKDYGYKDGMTAECLEKIIKLEPVPLEDEGFGDIDRNLSWRYPYVNSVGQPAKMTVSELKNRHQEHMEGDYLAQHTLSEKQNFHPHFFFPKTEDLTPVERGMAYHTVMQHINLGLSFSRESICRQLEQMVGCGILSHSEIELVNTEDIFKFFSSPLGERMKKARDVYREVPFTLSVPPSEMLLRKKSKGHNSELLLIHEDDRLILQGVVDCILVEKEGLIIIDYKSDDTSRLTQDALKKKYHYQLTLYGQAVEKIWRVKVMEKFLYFFNGGFAVPLK